MSLNTIELKDIMLGELYRGNLLATEGPSQPVQPPKPAQKVTAPVAETQTPLPAPPTSIPAVPPASYKFLGKNNKNITIIVQSPGIAFLPDDQLNFLSKMLEACKMNVADVAILNHASVPIRIATAKIQLQPSFLLLFGLGPVDIGLPMDFPQFKIQAYDQCSYLSAPPLGHLLVPGDDAKLLKSKLWVSLKSLFGI